MKVSDFLEIFLLLFANGGILGRFLSNVGPANSFGARSLNYLARNYELPFNGLTKAIKRSFSSWHVSN